MIAPCAGGRESCDRLFQLGPPEPPRARSAVGPGAGGATGWRPMGTPMAHVSKSMLGRQANSHLKSSPSFGFGTEERAKASSAKSGGLTSSPGPVYYPLSTTYNNYPKSPSHSFGAAHRYTKVTSADSSHRTRRTGRGDTVPRACSHESAALGAPQLATLASSGGVPRPSLLSTPSEKPPSHCDPAVPPPPLTSQQLAAEWGGHTLRAQALPTDHSPLPTPHGPYAQSLTYGVLPRLCPVLKTLAGGSHALRHNTCDVLLTTGAGARHVSLSQRGERAEELREALVRELGLRHQHARRPGHDTH